ncbi:MAG: bifunctional sugar-1-phosphate nucleotidylyltransferase/acetyltransferase [Candidatus Kariarchaeaceae archaeon]|jgi:bifunctional UDP-N-acetylglucosamine pyrophosphorylase/glucosamine-1-phosphate N-acetyltransferase
MNIVKAIVLAAGHGKRLLPITSNRPKHLLEIAGKPILKRLLDSLLQENQIEEIYVVVHYFAELIKNATNNWYKSEQNLLKRIKFVHQEQPIGTGDAVKCALQEFDPIDDFMVIYGDLIVGDSISNMLQLYENQDYSGYILGVPVDQPEKFGVFETKNKILTSIIEKPPSAEKGSLINGGLYILPKSARDLIFSLGLSKRDEVELTDVLSELINTGSKLFVMQFDSGWFDIGHPWQLLEANEYLLVKSLNEKELFGKIEQRVSINGNVHIAKTARIRSGAYIEGPVFIDEGADIGPNCYIRGNTYLGPNVRVGNGCEIKNSIVYGNTHIAHLSYVGDSIIGENTNFGAGTITANLRHDGKNVKVTIKGKRENSGRRKLGVITGDFVKTGIGVNILPGVIISSNSWINAGEVVKKDI